MKRLKLFLTINLTLHAAAIAVMHITGRSAGILTAVYWTLLTIRLAIEMAEGMRR